MTKLSAILQTKSRRSLGVVGITGGLLRASP